MTHAEMQDLLSAYALGALDETDAEVVRSHLNEGCAECSEEVESYRRLSGLFAVSAPAVDPPAELKERVLVATMAGDKPEIEEGAGEVRPSQLIRADQGSWKEPFPGIHLKTLSRNARAGTSTVLMRMDPGSVLPPHLHYGPEEVFVLEGEGEQGSIHYRVGDYLRVEAGTIHPHATTKAGCLMLVILPELEFMPAHT